MNYAFLSYLHTLLQLPIKIQESAEPPKIKCSTFFINLHHIEYNSVILDKLVNPQKPKCRNTLLLFLILSRKWEMRNLSKQIQKKKKNIDEQF